MKTGFQRKMTVAVLCLSVLCSIPFYCLADELTLRGYRDTWAEEEKPGYWTVSLRFNHPVFADNLKSATKVTLDGLDEPFELRDPQEDRKASGAAKEFRLVPTRPARLAASVKVVVDQGLSDASGRLLMKREFTYRFLYGERITVNNFGTFYRTRTDKGLNLDLSAAVEQNELTAAMKITPSVPNLTVTRVGQLKYQITGDFAYDQQYLLQISEVPVNDGRALLTERKFNFQGPGIKHMISVRTERSVVELKGRQLLPLTLADVTKVRCSLIRMPPYLVPQAVQALANNQPIGRIQSPERKKGLESLVKTGRVFAGFLGEFAQSSEAFFAPEARDHVFGYSLPLSFRASPDKGGIWVASLSDPDGNFKGETSRLVQITDLSVSYKLSANNLLLWVTSLHTGQPVSGVELLLDRADGFRSFVGKTDKNGVLFLRDGDKFPSVRVGHESSGVANQPLPVAQVTWAIAATAADTSRGISE